jgi:tetratricopeptide (TPR) repeat protein
MQETAGGSAATSVDGGDGAPRGHCWICLEGNGDDEGGSAGAAGGSSVGSLLHQGCGCRGAAGFAHLACLVDYAVKQPREGELLQWQDCRTCEQSFTGDMQLGLAQAHWEILVQAAGLGDGLPVEDWERLSAMNRLAGALQDCSRDYEAALPLLEECLVVARRVGGDEHPNTLTSIGNLADLHREMGDLEQALALGTEALAVKRRTLGSEDPGTLASINNLAGVHLAARSYDLALPLFEEALDARRRTQGDQHAATLHAIYNLAAVRHAMGELAEAVALLHEAVAGFRRVLGEEHPETQNVVEHLRDVSEALEAIQPEEEEEEEEEEAKEAEEPEEAKEAEEPEEAKKAKEAEKAEANQTGASRRSYESWQQARVVGIQGRPELNGRLVRVGELIAATGRFRVLVPASEV